jgi:hypothetical protein
MNVDFGDQVLQTKCDPQPSEIPTGVEDWHHIGPSISEIGVIAQIRVGDEHLPTILEGEQGHIANVSEGIGISVKSIVEVADRPPCCVNEVCAELVL